MKRFSSRNACRSRTWPDTRATIELYDFICLDGRKMIRLSGSVTDIGADGMFLKTEEDIPVPARAKIVLCFDPNAKRPVLLVPAEGKVIRKTGSGIGIYFTHIDLMRLQRCIVAKMNMAEASSIKGPARVDKPPEIESRRPGKRKRLRKAVSA